MCWPGLFQNFLCTFLFPQEIKEGKVCLKQNLSTYVKPCNLIQYSCSVSPQSWFISSWKCSSLGRMSYKNFGPEYCWFFVTCCSCLSQRDRAEILRTAQGDAFPGCCSWAPFGFIALRHSHSQRKKEIQKITSRLEWLKSDPPVTFPISYLHSPVVLRPASWPTAVLWKKRGCKLGQASLGNTCFEKSLPSDAHAHTYCFVRK